MSKRHQSITYAVFKANSSQCTYNNLKLDVALLETTPPPFLWDRIVEMIANRCWELERSAQEWPIHVELWWAEEFGMVDPKCYTVQIKTDPVFILKKTKNRIEKCEYFTQDHGLLKCVGDGSNLCRKCGNFDG